MHLSSDAQIRDGLLAANALLVENSRQGFETINSTVHWHSGVLISHTSLEMSGPMYDARVMSRCTGKERDTESGLDYFGARYYGSSMGRFSSADDPIFADQTNPQSWNLYSYVQNNPLTNTDPDGHDCVVQSRTSNTTESVTTSAGNCDNVSVGDGQTKTYVPGTVTSITANGGNSIDIGYNSYDRQSSGVTNASSAPIPNNPGLAYNWGNNAQGYQQLGAASRAVKAGTVGYAVVFGSVMGAGVLADALAGGGLTTIGDVASPLLTNQEAADAIGWGTHFEGEGLQATKDLAAKLTQNEVSEMESKGLTLGDAEKWRKVFQTAVNAGKGGEQAKARLMLMNKIFRIMVGGR